MTPSEFMEKLLIQCVTGLSGTRRHEDVTTNVLVDNLTVCIYTAEGYVDVAIKLNSHLVKRKIPIRRFVQLQRG